MMGMGLETKCKHWLEWSGLPRHDGRAELRPLTYSVVVLTTPKGEPYRGWSTFSGPTGQRYKEIYQILAHRGLRG